MTSLTDLKKRLFDDPEFREEYEKADAEFSIIEASVHAKTEARLSRIEIAKPKRIT